MRIILVALFLVAGCALLSAESASERQLRLQLEAASREKAELTAALALAKANANAAAIAKATKGAAATKEVVQTQVEVTKKIGAEAAEGAAIQTEATERASVKAEKSANDASEQLTQLIKSNRSVGIVQFYMFLGLALAGIFAIVERRATNKEAERKEKAANAETVRKETAAIVETQRREAWAAATTGKLQQIHTLVNSKLTEALQSALKAHMLNLLIFQKMAATPDVIAQVLVTQREISSLETELAHRQEQTELADKQAKDEKKKEGT